MDMIEEKVEKIFWKFLQTLKIEFVGNKPEIIVNIDARFKCIRQICQLFEKKLGEYIKSSTAICELVEASPNFIEPKPDKGRLLTNKERTTIGTRGGASFYAWGNEEITALLEAQRDLTASIVDKQARQELIKEIESKIIYISLDLLSGKPELYLQTNAERSAQKWQELKRKWGVK